PSRRGLLEAAVRLSHVHVAESWIRLELPVSGWTREVPAAVYGSTEQPVAAARCERRPRELLVGAVSAGPVRVPVAIPPELAAMSGTLRTPPSRRRNPMPNAHRTSSIRILLLCAAVGGVLAG